MDDIVSMLLPSSLSNIIRRLNGYKRDIVEVRTVTSSTATANETVTMRFPSNSLINPSSFAIFSDIFVDHDTNGARMANNFGLWLPNVESFISNWSLKSNSTQIEKISNYGLLHHTLSLVSVSTNCKDMRAATGCLAPKSFLCLQGMVSFTIVFLRRLLSLQKYFRHKSSDYHKYLMLLIQDYYHISKKKMIVIV
jgi:hypothetical protein